MTFNKEVFTVEKRENKTVPRNRGGSTERTGEEHFYILQITLFENRVSRNTIHDSQTIFLVNPDSRAANNLALLSLLCISNLQA